MTAPLHAHGSAEPGEEAPPSPFPPRAEPQPQAPWRLPRCESCDFLLDALGHFWACLAPKRRRR
jgi:hypothetical protein